MGEDWDGDLNLCRFLIDLAYNGNIIFYFKH